MLTLYTAPTPNGWKASVALEELGRPYTVHALDLGRSDQKAPWFLQINPNGRIPAIVDHENGDFAVFESGAILVYLAEWADAERAAGRPVPALWPADAKGRSVALQWLMFQMGGVGPMMGQANVFSRYAPEPIPFAIDRYRRESRRLFEVLDRRLAVAPYLAGDAYSLADIANWCWVHTHAWSGVAVEGLTHLSRWLDEIAARPAVVRGKNVPTPPAHAEQVVAAGRALIE